MQIALSCHHCKHQMLIEKPPFPRDANCDQCGQFIVQLTSGVDKNTLIGNRYQVRYPISNNGYSDLYIATDIESNELCLIRVFNPAITPAVSNPNDTLDLLSSVSILGGKSHLSISDYGIDDNFMYTVSPYVEIESLTDIVDNNTALEAGDALNLCREILLSLDEAAIATETGHFNLTPDNIFIDHLGNVHYIDFGLSTHLTSDSLFLNAGLEFWNLHYLSPEMALGWNFPNQSSDIYSLGCIVFFALTGLEPFSSHSDPQSIDYGNLILPRRIEYDLNEDFLYIFRKMTAKDPQDRYQTYREAADAIESYHKVSGIRQRQQRQGRKTNIYDSIEFQHLESTFHKKRPRKAPGVHTQKVSRQSVRNKLSTQNRIQLPENFSGKIASSTQSRKTPAARRPGNRQKPHGGAVRRGKKKHLTKKAGQNKHLPIMVGIIVVLVLAILFLALVFS